MDRAAGGLRLALPAAVRNNPWVPHALRPGPPMTADPTDPFLRAARDAGLLDPARAADLSAWAAATRADSQAVAREAGRRGWLTNFQVKEVYWGRGADLVLGKYVVLDPIGEGGMGRVFKARDARLGRDVALKVIRKEKLSKPLVLQRFQQEIRAASLLNHPNVVMVFDADEARGVHFYAMEFVEGVDLTKLVRERGPLPVAQACEYVRQAAVGLQHAFERGLVHRDVKPSNLLVTPRGQVKVLDLGLAMLKTNPGGEDGGRVTQEGLVIGTPDFLAPEQAQNPTTVDIRADVYGLGGTLYYLLTGRVPFDGPTPTDKLLQHVTAPPPSLCAARPDAPPQLDAVIRWMMAKRPEDRPQTPAQAAAALQPFCTPGGFEAAAAYPGYHPPATAWPAASLPAGPPGSPAAVSGTGISHSLVSTPPAAPAGTPPAPPGFMPPPALERSERPPAPRPVRRSSGSSVVLKLVLLAAVLLGGAGAAAVVGYVLYTQVAGTTGGSVPAEYTNGIGMKLVRLDGGTFTMGSPDGEPGRDANEGPAGPVTVSGPFYVAATEVTSSQFAAVMQRNPARWPSKMRDGKSLPVDSVTWPDAVEFCRQLTAKDRTRRPGWEYRLPTEAEWEYACRAGTDTPFAYGPRLVLGKNAVFDLDKEVADKTDLGDVDLTKQIEKLKLPYPVGTHEPNPWGLYDMHGNVWEWCADGSTADYAGRADKDPTGPEGTDQKVIRGGSWREPANKCRSATRRGLSQSASRDDVGFRVVLAPAGK